MNRVDVIRHFIEKTAAKTYLEIGVRNGDSFVPIKCEKKIAVDVVKRPFPLGELDEFYEMSSNEYFEKYAKPFDVAFVDGDHSYPQSLMDAQNCLSFMNSGGVILFHDCNPEHEDLATPSYVGAHPDWCGEVWKTVLTLRTDANLSVYTLNIDYGIGIVFNKTGQKPDLRIHSEIPRMRYKDLEKNRKKFLNLIEVDDDFSYPSHLP